MSTIAAGTTSGTALVSTGDTTGALVLQTNGTTTAVTIGTNQVVTLAQPLPVGSGGTGGSATPTAGGVVYGTGSAQAVTSAGTSGQVLTSAGSSAPTWSTPSGGAWVVLQSGTVSSVSTLDFETGFTDSTYIAIVIILDNFYSDGSGNPTWRFKQGGSYTSSAYEQQTIEASNTSISTNRSTSQTGMVLAAVQMLNTSPYSDVLIVKNRFSTVAAGPSIASMGTQSGSGVAKIGICQGVRQTGGAVQGARLYLSGGGGSTTLVSGTYTSYGIKAA